MCNRNCNCNRRYNRNCNCCNRRYNSNENFNYTEMTSTMYSSNMGNNRNCRNCCDSRIYDNICNNMNSTSAFPENYLYGHAYTPNQTMNNVFMPEIGLNHGTIFPELVSPYSPGQSMDFINSLREGGVHCE